MAVMLFTVINDNLKYRFTVTPLINNNLMRRDFIFLVHKAGTPMCILDPSVLSDHTNEAEWIYQIMDLCLVIININIALTTSKKCAISVIMCGIPEACVLFSFSVFIS